MTGCRRPEHAILPHGKSPKNSFWNSNPLYSSSRPHLVDSSPSLSSLTKAAPPKSKEIQALPKAVEALMYTPRPVFLIFMILIVRRDVFQMKRKERWKFCRSLEKISLNQIKKDLASLENLDRVAILTDSSFSSIRSSLLKGLQTSGAKFTITTR